MCVLCDKEKSRKAIGRNLSVMYLEVTPSQAVKILDDHNKANRVMKPTQVQRLASDIDEGRWQPDMPDMCGFDTSMNIVSAQHRLSAIVRAGKSAGIWFMFGLPEESRSVTDQAVVWSMADMVRKNGVEQYATMTATTLKSVVVWRLRLMRNASVKPSRINISKSKLAEELVNHPYLVESVRWANVNRGSIKYIPTSGLAFGHYILTQYGCKPHGQEFWNDCLVPGRLDTGDPRRAMLNMFERVHNDRVDNKVQGIYVYGIIKAWNLWVDGKSLQKMNYKSTHESGNMRYEKFEQMPQLTQCVCQGRHRDQG